MKAFGSRSEIAQPANEEGEFAFSGLEPGPYFLRVADPGYNEERTEKLWIARETRTKVGIGMIPQGMMRVCQ
jgi:hypothetical protein